MVSSGASQKDIELRWYQSSSGETSWWYDSTNLSDNERRAVNIAYGYNYYKGSSEIPIGKAEWGKSFVSVAGLKSIVAQQLTTGKGALLYQNEASSNTEDTQSFSWGNLYSASALNDSIGRVNKDNEKSCSVIEINSHGNPWGLWGQTLNKDNASETGRALARSLTPDGIIVLTACNTGLKGNDSFAQLLADASGHNVYASMGFVGGNFLQSGNTDVGKYYNGPGYKQNNEGFGSQDSLYRLFRPRK
jgi:hypothetical protein